MLCAICCLQWASNNLWPVNPDASQSAQSGRMAVMLILETGELPSTEDSSLSSVRRALAACDLHLTGLLQEARLL